MAASRVSRRWATRPARRREQRVDHEVGRELHLRGGVEAHHQRAGLLQFAEVVGGVALPRDDHGRGVQLPDLRDGGGEVAVVADLALGGRPVVVAAVDGGRQRERVEVAEEVGAAPPALEGGRQREALVDRLPAVLQGAVAAKQNRATCRVHAQRSYTTEGWKGARLLHGTTGLNPVARETLARNRVVWS